MERILCAALLFNGNIVAGYRHSDCYQTIANIHGVKMEDITSIPNLPSREEQGFLTSANRYVSRAEGYSIARHMNQLLLPHTDGCMEILTSEDLY